MTVRAIKKRLKKAIKLEKITEKKLKEEEALKPGLKEFSVESIEKTKNQLLQELLVDQEKLKTRLPTLIEINLFVLSIIQNEKDLVKIEEKIEKKKLTLSKEERNNILLANRIIDGLLYVLPRKGIFIEIKQHLNKGLDGLKTIETQLEKMKNIDKEKIETIALFYKQLLLLEDLIKEENAFLRRLQLILTPSFFRRITLSLHKKDLAVQYMTRFSELYRRELTEQIPTLKKAYSQVSALDDSNELRTILWLEKKEITLSEEALLLLNKFNTPKIVFPSNNFAVFNCYASTAMFIFQQGNIEQGDIIPYQREFNVGGEKANFNCLTYSINSVSKKFLDRENQVAFVFPLEELMKHKYFISEKNNLYVLSVANPEIITQKLISNYRDFGFLLKNIEKNYGDWVTEMQGLNKRFKKSFTERAEKIVKKGFTKKWISHVLPTFRLEGHTAYDSLLLLFEKEDLERMNKEQFKKAVKKTQDFYWKVIGRLTEFSKKATFNQDINNSIFFAPQNKILLWENYFKRLKKRPKIYYYSEKNLQEGIEKHWRKCAKTTIIKKLPRLIELDIRDIQTSRFVCRLNR